MSDTTWITLLGSVVGNERDGFETTYDWDREHFAAPALAAGNGFDYRRSDDFNIGEVQDGQLVGLWWMDDLLDESPVALAKIAKEIGL